MALLQVRVVSRSISPPWGSIRFRLVLRTYAPWGVRVVSQTKSRKIPTRNILPLFFVLQIATRKEVFLLDMIALNANGHLEAVNNGIAAIFTAQGILKLGFGSAYPLVALHRCILSALGAA